VSTHPWTIKGYVRIFTITEAKVPMIAVVICNTSIDHVIYYFSFKTPYTMRETDHNRTVPCRCNYSPSEVPSLVLEGLKKVKVSLQVKLFAL